MCYIFNLYICYYVTYFLSIIIGEFLFNTFHPGKRVSTTQLNHPSSMERAPLQFNAGTCCLRSCRHPGDPPDIMMHPAPFGEYNHQYFRADCPPTSLTCTSNLLTSPTSIWTVTSTSTTTIFIKLYYNIFYKNFVCLPVFSQDSYNSCVVNNNMMNLSLSSTVDNRYYDDIDIYQIKYVNLLKRNQE